MAARAHAGSKPGDLFVVDEAGRLLEIDLFFTFDELAGRLQHCLAAAQSADDQVRHDLVTDAFLLAAGMTQILEDRRHAEEWLVRKLAPHLRRHTRWLRGVVPSLQRASRGLAASRPSSRRLGTAAARTAALAERCASLVCESGSAGDQTILEFESEAHSVLASAEHLPKGVRGSVVKLAQCFRSFDQHPDDCRLLVHKFAARYPDLDRPILVVGLRTSGCYLGPLTAAELRAAGYKRVRVVTFRPRQRWCPEETAAVRTLVAGEGMALLVDDPPRTGNHLRACVDELRKLGVPDAAIVLVLQVFEATEALPPTLAGREAIVLPWGEWSIHSRLSPTAVEEVLRAVRGADVRCLRVDRFSVPRRGHAATQVEVVFSDRSGGGVTERLAVRGSGLGYLGRHAVAVHERLHELVPPLYAFADGMTFSAAPGEDERLTPERLHDEPGAVAEIARYIHERHRRLRVAADRTAWFNDREAAWEVAAEMLEAAFGRPRAFVRRLSRATAARLLSVDDPAIVDGDTEPRRWYGPPGALRKTAYAERAFSNLDLASYDPVFDLAGAAAASEAVEQDEAAAAIRSSYDELAGRPVDDERWYLHRLVHHARARDEKLAQGASGLEVPAALDEALRRERAMARAHQSYLEARYLSDLAPPERGPLCALDIDGVLETWWARFPALGPSGALVLRALNKHGYRVVLATGRSLGEVRDRCSAYRLAGGVAEYGAVVYDHVAGLTTDVASRDELAPLATVRTALQGLRGTYVDRAYTRSLRAYRVSPPGRRRALSDDEVEMALAMVGGSVQVVQGRLQTDFVPAAVDKGRGARTIGELLGVDGGSGKLLALGLGDTGADLPFLALAELAFAPATATDEVKRRIQTTSGSEQRGLAEAVTRLLGHEPGGCALCRPLPVPANARLLLSALAALDGGWLSKAQAVRLLARIARTSP